MKFPMLVLGLFCFLTLIIVSLSQREKQDDLKSLLDGHSAGSANLVEHQHRYLRMQRIMCSDFVYDSMQCALNFLVAVRCRSFNFKMQVELDGRHLCEILASDKYNHSPHILNLVPITTITVSWWEQLCMYFWSDISFCGTLIVILENFVLFLDYH